MSVVTSSGRDALYISVREMLVPDDVEKIQSVLASVSAGSRVIIDFRDARAFEPAPLIRLALDLCGTDLHVSLRGLSEYHYRLLRYVGLPQHPLTIVVAGSQARQCVPLNAGDTLPHT